MKNEITINLRAFPVLAHDHRDGQEEAITVTVTKEQLQAAQIVGQSSKELIERLCDRQGYTVLEIGKPGKLAVAEKGERPMKEPTNICPLLAIAGAGGTNNPAVCIEDRCAWWDFGGFECAAVTAAIAIREVAENLKTLAAESQALYEFAEKDRRRCSEHRRRQRDPARHLIKPSPPPL